MNVTDADWRQFTVPTPRGYVHTRIGGPPSGAPVVLVHGFVLAGDYMMPAAERLASLTRVYVPDLPGYGLSDRPAGRSICRTWPTVLPNGWTA